jgi:hypothetical protein
MIVKGGRPNDTGIGVTVLESPVSRWWALLPSGLGRCMMLLLLARNFQ